jgi:hypothetical protein
MQDQENRKATPDEKIAHQARNWRARDKDATVNRSDKSRRAEYHARQKLREAIDTQGGR